MSDTINDPVPAEKPVNQGGGNEPEANPDETTEDDALVAAETPVNHGGGGNAD